MRGDIKSAIDNFLNLVQTQTSFRKNIVEGLTIVSASYHGLLREADTMPFQEIKIERNKIIKALLYFLDLADETVS